MTTPVETLVELVDHPSETGHEGRICTAIAARLLPRFGATGVQRVNNSLVVGNRTGRPLVLLVGHLDTVPRQGQGPARIEDGRLHGLGASDMKAGLAVMIHLLEDQVMADRGRFDLVGIFYEGEEGPSTGNGLEPVLQRMRWLTEATLALVLEPTDGVIELGCNGVVNATVVFKGRSAHSARPWSGENAVTKAGAWLAKMHQREPEPYLVEGLEYKEVMSVTTAFGGIAKNIIPATFTLNLNYRFNPTRTEDEAIQELFKMCDDADSVEISDTAPAGPVRAADHVLVTALAEILGSPPAPKQGWTDVARLGIYGIPAINYGPGEAVQAHQATESVELAALDRALEALRTVLGD